MFLQNVWWPRYQPPLLDTAGVLLVIALCVCPQQGEAGVMGPMGPMVRDFQRRADSFFFYFALVLQKIVNVKVVYFSFSFLLSRDDKEYSCFRMINVLQKRMWLLPVWCCKLLS